MEHVIEIDNILTILTPLLLAIIPALAVYLKKYKNIINHANQITNALANTIENNTHDIEQTVSILKDVGKKSKLTPEQIMRLPSTVKLQSTQFKEPLNKIQKDSTEKFQTNLSRGSSGLILKPEHDFLEVWVANARSYTTLKLLNMQGNVLDIAQTDGTKPTRIKVYYYESSGAYRILKRLKGQFRFHVVADSGSSDSIGYNQTFEIL